MEKTERETHDFMNVESFSQLPFIRPTPVKEKGIRLFGKEFSAEFSSSNTDESHSAETNNACERGVKVNDNGESSRKFECHYCCRNFPTSQALGGHQNAHKRERQHAKRAHLQSAMIHGGFSDPNAYGYMNYPLASAQTPVMAYHQSWTTHGGNANVYASSNRFFGGGGATHGASLSQPPITGSPLGLWRIPPVHTHSFGRDRSLNPVQLFTSAEMKPSLTGSTSQNRFGYESKPASMQDHVSLDLRL